MANLVIRFIVEMTAYAGLSYWGAANGSSVVARVVLAIFTPRAAMGRWSLLLAAKRWRLRDPTAVGSELAIFTGAAVALGTSRLVGRSQAFIGVAVFTTIAVRLFDRWPSSVEATSRTEPTVIRGGT
ncbi:MAG TPA: YrdB family protein [Acidimicrobiales bacterium]|nr:YrdB family protein [Acidimicrobiales bacterium]